MYGLSECLKGSPRHERISYDTDLACKIIKSICPDIGDYAICDCSRIGPYSEARTRPLIVKFARSYDVATVPNTPMCISNPSCQLLNEKLSLHYSKREEPS